QAPLFNLKPSQDSPARLGFIAVDFPVTISFKVRSDSDYGLTATAHGAGDFFTVNGVQITTWGIPADPSHDSLRMTVPESLNCQSPCNAPGNKRPMGFDEIPFMSNGTSCTGTSGVKFDLTAQQLPGQLFTATVPLPGFTGCDSVPFAPTLTAQPTSNAAGGPTGLDFDIQIPQDGLSQP